jgi:hypothetical protein
LTFLPLPDFSLPSFFSFITRWTFRAPFDDFLRVATALLSSAFAKMQLQCRFTAQWLTSCLFPPRDTSPGSALCINSVKSLS